jgi:NADH pyrophosphatase NudC (nudix superfamily)
VWLWYELDFAKHKWQVCSCNSQNLFKNQEEIKMSERKCRYCGKALTPIFHGDALAGWYCKDCKKGVYFAE